MRSGVQRVMLALFVLVASCGDGATPASEEEAELLFVLGARAGTYDDGTLTLDDLEGHVIAFTNRPVRQALRMEWSVFIEAWSAFGFEETPPNAALEFVDPDSGASRISVVELANPVLASESVTFDATVLPIGTLSQPASESTPTETPSPQFESANVFIDDGGAWEAGCMAFSAFNLCDPL